MPLFDLAGNRQPRVHPQTWKDIRAALSDARIRMIKRAINRWVSDQLAQGIETPFADTTTKFIDTHLPREALRRDLSRGPAQPAARRDDVRFVHLAGHA